MPRCVGARQRLWYAGAMAPRFEPFAGLRYDPSIPLDKVIAPPYDIVGAEERARLAGRHLANAIHVELPVEDPRTGSTGTSRRPRIWPGGWRRGSCSVSRGRPSTPTG